MDRIEELFNILIMEAERGTVYIDEEEYNIHFHTSLNDELFDDGIPVLKIKNKQRVISLLREYMSQFHFQETEDMKIKKRLAFLWVNATYSDFLSPEVFIQRQIDFQKNAYISNCSLENITGLDNSHIQCQALPYSQETPFAFFSTIYKGNDTYSLPTISYGISNNICYIYAIQNKIEKTQPSPFYKKMKRKLYKINDGLEDSEEYIQYKNGESEYYPENISDVSPSAILALTLFLKQLQKIDIHNIRVVSFLPIRYQAKTSAIYQKIEIISSECKWKEFEKKKKMLEMEKEQLRVQNNVTQKLIRNFFRLQFHFNNIKIISYPMDGEEEMKIIMEPFTFSNNSFLEGFIKQPQTSKGM